MIICFLKPVIPRGKFVFSNSFFTHYVNGLSNSYIWCFAVLDFIDNEAVDDAWVVVSYLSEADCLLTGSPIASYNSENMAQLIAASVAARGVLFGNAHAATSRYLDCQHCSI